MSAKVAAKTLDEIPAPDIKDYAPAKGSVTKHPVFTSEHIEEAAKQMKKAFAGLATDEDRIIKNLTIHTNSQRQDLKKIYLETMGGSSLEEDLKNELAGTFEELCLALLLPSREFDAVCLHDAMLLPDRCEEWIMQILAPRSREEITQIAAAFKTKYDKELEEALKEASTGMFQRVLLAMLREGRDELSQEQLDMDLVRRDASALQHVADGHMSDTDDEIFTEMFAQRGWLHLKAVFADFAAISGRDMRQSFEDDAFRFKSKQAFTTIVRYANDPYQYIAECIHAAFHEDYLADVCNYDCDADTVLIRLIVAHSETDLENIKTRYTELYGEPLEDAVKRRCAGDYSKLLVKLTASNIA